MHLFLFSSLVATNIYLAHNYISDLLNIFWLDNFLGTWWYCSDCRIQRMGILLWEWINVDDTIDNNMIFNQRYSIMFHHWYKNYVPTVIWKSCYTSDIKMIFFHWFTMIPYQWYDKKYSPKSYIKMISPSDIKIIFH